jgi:hypothetical protein
LSPDEESVAGPVDLAVIAEHDFDPPLHRPGPLPATYPGITELKYFFPVADRGRGGDRPEDDGVTGGGAGPAVARRPPDALEAEDAEEEEGEKAPADDGAEGTAKPAGTEEAKTEGDGSAEGAGKKGEKE